MAKLYVETFNIDLSFDSIVFLYLGYSRGGPRKFKGSKKQHSVPNAHVRSEIKDLEQIRKERQMKANRLAHLKSKSSKKGKQFGRNGKKGKGGGHGKKGKAK